MNDADYFNHQPLVRAFASRGKHYLQQRDLEEAQRYYAAALRLLEEIDDLERNASLKVGVAHIAWLCGHTTEALQSIDKALALFDHRPFPRELALTHKEIGEFFAEVGERSLSGKHLGTARDIFDRIGVAYQVEHIDALGVLGVLRSRAALPYPGRLAFSAL